MVNEIVHPRIGVAAAELVAECLGREGRFGSIECDYHGLVEDHTRGTVAYLDAESPMSDGKRSNIIGALRVFFREFCDREVMEVFTLPSSQTKLTDVPPREELQTFYEAIENPKYEALFLFAATLGLRSGELTGLTMDDIDEAKRMIVLEKESSTKQTRVTFYSEEAEQAFERFNPDRDPDDERVFQTVKQPASRKFRQISEQTGVKVTIQKLRRWFATEMSRCGVDAEYIDAFCGRTKSSVLEKHYLDYSPERLKHIYDEAGIAVLDQASWINNCKN